MIHDKACMVRLGHACMATPLDSELVLQNRLETTTEQMVAVQVV